MLILFVQPLNVFIKVIPLQTLKSPVEPVALPADSTLKNLTISGPQNLLVIYFFFF